jgi:hypothetical protein
MSRQATGGSSVARTLDFCAYLNEQTVADPDIQPKVVIGICIVEVGMYALYALSEASFDSKTNI